MEDSSDEDAKGEEAAGASDKEHAPFREIYKVIIPLGAALSFLMLFLIISFMITRLGYRRLGDRERFLLLCKKNLKLLRRLGIRMEQGETLEELQTRSGNILGVESFGFISDYEAVLYAGAEADKNMCRTAEADRHMIYELIKERRGRLAAIALSF